MKTQDIKNLASAYMQVLEAEKKMDKVNPKALDKDFDDRKDKDIDNDGDVDKSDEYLHNRRKAVKKAMKDDEMSEAKSAAQQAAIAIAKKEKGMSEDDDLDELSLSVKDFKKTGLNKTVTKNKDQLKKDIEAMKSRLKKEEAEQVDELSRKTLGSYAKKAGEDLRVNTGSGQRLKGMYGPSSKGSAELKKAAKRQQGLNRAIDKLTKEEVDLDEAAPKMQGDWLKKQRERDRAHNAAMGRTATGRKKPQRAMTSTQRSLASLRREETEELDENKALMKDYQAMKAQGKKDHNILDTLRSMAKYKGMSRDRMAKIIGDAKRKGIFKEDLELEEGAKEKALKALMTKALGGKKAKPGYTSAVANNGDFVVKDGGGRIVGRIKSGDYKDPLKESNLDEAKLLSREDVAKLVVKKLGNKKFKADSYAQIAAIKEILRAHPRQKILATDREFIEDVLDILYNKYNLKYVKEELDEAMSKATRRALQSVKAQPKDKVSLKPAPWDKKKDTKNMSMKEKLQLQKEAILEREMTDAEMKKREDIVKGMKKDSEDMKKRYGAKWKDVMYATATKQAMESVDKALSMTKGLLTTKESFDTEDTKWPVYAKIKENRAMQTKGAAPGDPKMMDKMTASDKAFIDAHSANDLDGIDSGIDGAKAAADTAKNAAAQVKSGAGMNRTGDQKTGDKNIVKSTEAK